MTDRLEHPELLIFILGGTLAAGLNFSTALVLHGYFGILPGWAFFFSTLLNQGFHLFYYRIVYVNRETPFKTSDAIQLPLHVLVAVAAAIILSWTMTTFQLGFGASVITVIATLSFFNILLTRMATFGSAKLAMVQYKEVGESFYDDQTDIKKVSRFRAWYHRSRYERLSRFVQEHYRKGQKLVDLGCGNCWWNSTGLPVTGVDINGKMLRWAKRNGRLRDFKVVEDISKTGLKTHGYDLVIMTEVLEHLFDLKGSLAEVDRLLKDKGQFLLTVPYDYFMGPFFVLFNLNCIFQGFVLGSVYHRYRCGHIHHYDKGRLKMVLETNGFTLKQIFVVNGLLLYAIAEKSGKTPSSPTSVPEALPPSFH